MELEDKNWEAWRNKWKPTVDKWNKKLEKAKTEQEKKAIWKSAGSWREYRAGISFCPEDFTYGIRKEGLKLFAEYYEGFWW